MVLCISCESLHPCPLYWRFISYIPVTIFFCYCFLFSAMSDDFILFHNTRRDGIWTAKSSVYPVGAIILSFSDVLLLNIPFRFFMAQTKSEMNICRVMRYSKRSEKTKYYHPTVPTIEVHVHASLNNDLFHLDSSNLIIFQVT